VVPWLKLAQTSAAWSLYRKSLWQELQVSMFR